ncbi:CarD family transcriptional regulator [Georgenia sp. Z1491]|uniref:CarD family transcriptional regulator n=1 Tax=Georgenia sp. Z1491 TaxID=3416707 RepID=UPI003CF97767
MPVVPGQTVVHPHHGPSTVDTVFTRTVKGAKVSYARLQVLGQDLTVAVPVDMLDEVGVRDVMDLDRIGTIFEVLVAESLPFEKVWSRRMKSAQDRVATGDLLKVAEVVRDLRRREEEPGISFGERTLMRDALLPLVSELAIGLEIDEEAADQMVDRAILEQVSPDLTPAARATLAPAS